MKKYLTIKNMERLRNCFAIAALVFLGLTMAWSIVYIWLDASDTTRKITGTLFAFIGLSCLNTLICNIVRDFIEMYNLESHNEK